MMTDAREIEQEAADAVDAVMKPGIYTAEEIPAAFYHRMPAVASHMLQGFYRTPAHAKEAILHPFDGSAEQQFGQAFHMRVLEPERFPLEYILTPAVEAGVKATKAGLPNKRDPKGKEAWAVWEERAKGKQVLTPVEWDKIDAMARSVERHPAAREILAAPGMNEVTVIWDQDVKDGEGELSVVRCRARIDILRTIADDTWIWDLKSTVDASEREFEKQIARYHYHMQLGFYALGMNALAPAPRRVGFIASEKERPYAVNVLELDALDLEQGQRDALAHLKTYVECMRTGIFPAYGDGMGYVGLPPWAKKEE